MYKVRAIGSFAPIITRGGWQFWVYCLELEHFIKKYTPGFWKETIGTVCFVPSVLPKDLIAIKIGEIPGRFDKWYFKEAIKTWLFEKDLTKQE